MFAVVYWGEGAYRLLECGDTAGASAALNRQTTAAQALIKVLPDLAEARIETALAANDWRPLAADRAHGFPMNLLGNEPLMRVSANTSPRH